MRAGYRGPFLGGPSSQARISAASCPPIGGRPGHHGHHFPIVASSRSISEEEIESAVQGVQPFHRRFVCPWCRRDVSGGCSRRGGDRVYLGSHDPGGPTFVPRRGILTVAASSDSNPPLAPRDSTPAACRRFPPHRHPRGCRIRRWRL